MVPKVNLHFHGAISVEIRTAEKTPNGEVISFFLDLPPSLGDMVDPERIVADRLQRLFRELDKHVCLVAVPREKH